MINRDKIFYLACALSAAGVVLALLGYDVALLLFVAAYLLRPALHEFGFANQYADERQLTIHARSGNIALIIVVLAAVGLALWRIARGEQPEDLYMLIAIALAARAITGLVMNGDYRRAGAVILGAVGLFAAAFVLMDIGLSVTGILVALAIVGVFLGFGWLGRRFPLTGAVILLLFALGAVARFGLLDFRSASLGVWLLLITPLVISATCLLVGRFGGDDGISPRIRTVVFGSLAFGAAAIVTISLLSAADHDRRNPPGTSTALPKGEVQDIQGIPCTGQLEYYPSGSLKSFTLAREDTLSGQPLAAGTVVHLTEDGALDWCFLQENTHIQGHFCRGEGHGFMTCFHPNGQIKLAWLVEDEEIDGVPCAKWSFVADAFGGGSGTHFWDNGTLKRCRLSRDFTIQGQDFAKGDVVSFDADGTLITRQGE